MEKIAIKVTSLEHGKRVIKYLESLGGANYIQCEGSALGYYYFITQNGAIRYDSHVIKGYTEAFLPEGWKPTEQKLPEDIKTFRATAALMRLSFYKVEDEERFSKAVRDADELIKELNK